MAFDPLTGVGLALGLLGFLVSSIQNTANAAYAFSRASMFLESRMEELRTSQQVLRCWRERWFEGVRILDESTAVHLWGTDGFRDIKQRVKSIEQLEEELTKALRAKPLLDGIHRREWRDTQRTFEFVTGATGEVPDLAVELNINVLHRLTDALILKGPLEDMLARYNHKIKQLTTNCNVYFNARHGHADEEVPTQEQVRDRLSAARAAENFANNLRQIFDRRLKAAKWSLVMTAMSDFSDDCQAKQDGVLGMQFLEFNSQGWHLLDAQWHWETRCMLVTRASPATLTNPIIYSLLCGDLSREAMQRTHIARAKAALCLAGWVTLMWDAEYFRGIRSRDVHHASCRNQDLAEQDSPITYRHPQCLTSAAAIPRDMYDRDIDLLLGTLLAELALGRHINIRSSRRFELSEGRNYETVTWADLVDMVQGKAGLGYAKAVEYCFRYSRRRREHSKSGRTSLYIEKVVKPLQSHYDRVCQAPGRIAYRAAAA